MAAFAMGVPRTGYADLARPAHDAESLRSHYSWPYGIRVIVAGFGISAHVILVFCDHSAVMVRIGTRLSSAEFALFPSFGSASRTRDGEYLFWA
jgi:hypothetical protein